MPWALNLDIDLLLAQDPMDMGLRLELHPVLLLVQLRSQLNSLDLLLKLLALDPHLKLDLHHI
jgi:hypothetical protein|uniref:Uncharacterized protein n=1 Tax=Picea glauca TaxID=3330 RepID=A0A101M142_PICGL|nr:hypothetical protein ABT39_MTgene4335 [Picea glauca]QHR88462.1 hypothetical protein Q903MT_gene2475 [Picea sitchensis]